MPKFADYRSQLDKFKSRLDPESLQAMNDWAQRWRQKGTPGAEADQARGIAAWPILKKKFEELGLTDQQIKNLDLINAGVTLKPQDDMNAFSSLARVGMANPEQLNAMFAEFDRQPEEENTDEIMGKIRAFVDKLETPDPAIAARIQERAVAAAQKSAGRAGAYGKSGLGARTSAGMQIKGDSDYTMQRQALQSQGLGLMNARDLGLSQLEQGYAQMQQERDEADWAGKQNQSQAIMGAIGTGLGALGGAYFGGAQGAQMGAQFGGQFAAGLGGIGRPSPTYTSLGSPRTRSRPQRTQGGGGQGF